ncbi:MAG: amidohydrolase family protein [Candidatus Binatia bacterium]
MNIDVHAHFVPPDSLKVASEIGKGQGLALAKNEAGRDVLSRGGFLPYTWGRLDRGYRIKDSAAAKISKPPSAYLKLLHFDTITHSAMALEYLVANFGAEHVLLGSDYPHDMGDPQPVESLGQTKIAGNELELISSANACKLFGIGI